ncbi:Hypothetical protein BRZCDTV_10 [Brazilian cedratvirus IHUMI]|uniref:Uncharacterized protein n=1 Tax=Brazilian cedratvirus IHUMI TaxID=2126980 RepID=A0A2R8FD19_9VIRU|nr:Hypothetical protein BRZCDTV_10 [Brazilian cedratvirus IHUMI]
MSGRRLYCLFLEEEFYLPINISPVQAEELKEEGWILYDVANTLKKGVPFRFSTWKTLSPQEALDIMLEQDPEKDSGLVGEIFSDINNFPTLEEANQQIDQRAGLSFTDYYMPSRKAR